MSQRIAAILMIIFFSLATTKIGAAESVIAVAPASVELLHQNLVQRLSTDQTSALEKVYSNFRLVALCPGNFSGHSQDERVLGVWKPVESDKPWKRIIHRVGLIRNNSAWEVHVIDDEIEKDEELSHSFPMHWQYKVNEQEFSGEMKCGVESEFGKDSDLTYALGDRPFFDLTKAGLTKNKVACFATDDVYNNWDCVVYSPNESRFKLWFQQAHAD